VAGVENTTPSSSCLVGAGGFPGARAQHGGKRPWPLVSGSVPSPRKRAPQYLFSVARTSVIDRGALAQPTRIVVYGTVCTVVWQGSARDLRPYADQCDTSVRVVRFPIRRGVLFVPVFAARSPTRTLPLPRLRQRRLRLFGWRSKAISKESSLSKGPAHRKFKIKDNTSQRVLRDCDRIPLCAASWFCRRCALQSIHVLLSWRNI
jgi:hypothetical protein